MTALSAAARLRQLLADSNQIIVCPGVYDGLTARIALQSGFEALYMVTVPLPPGQPTIQYLALTNVITSRLGQVQPRPGSGSPISG